MEKLSKFKDVFNRENLKKGAVILGAAATLAGTVALTGCQQPTGGSEPTPIVIPEPQPEPKPEENYEQPCDMAVGNGYILHSFIGNTGVDFRAEKKSYYFEKAGTYVKNNINNLSKSLQGRPSAQDFFSNYIDQNKNNNYFNIQDQDRAGDILADSTEEILATMAKSFNTEEESYAFMTLYRYSANAALKYGSGQYFGRPALEDNIYNKEEKKLQTFVQANNNYFEEKNIDVTNLNSVFYALDELVGTATANINNAQNCDLRKNDLKNFINCSLCARPYQAMDIIDGNNCNISYGVNIALEKACKEVSQRIFQQQNQGMMQ